MNQDFRWVAVITYHTTNGLSEVEHHIEELNEIEGLVERGPDWNAIYDIGIRLNPRRRLYQSDTVEKAARR